MLEILLSARGRPVTKRRLADLLWQEEDCPVHPDRALETYISRARASLASVSPGQESILSEPGAYRLAEQVRTDLDEFEALVGAGDLASLCRALELVRGEPFGRDPAEGRAFEFCERFRSLHLGTMETAASAALQAREFATAVVLARSTLGRDPMSETACRILMVGSYATGRQAEALLAYEGCRGALREALGVNPMPETAALHQRILRGEPWQSLLPPPSD